MPAQHPAIILTFWTFAFWLLQLVARGFSLVRAETTLKGRATSVEGRTTLPLLFAVIVVLHAAATVYSSRP